MVDLVAALYRPVAVTFLMVTVKLYVNGVGIYNVSLSLTTILVMTIITKCLFDLAGNITIARRLGSCVGVFSALKASLFMSIVNVATKCSLGAGDGNGLCSIVIKVLVVVSSFTKV